MGETTYPRAFPKGRISGRLSRMLTAMLVLGLLAAPPEKKEPEVPAEAPAEVVPEGKPEAPKTTPKVVPVKTPAKSPAKAPAGSGPDAEPKAAPLVEYPHPLITEVLFAVPTGTEGDANGDGTRSATGDEFIEIVNPHARPIELAGYTLSDKRASEKDKKGQSKSGAVKFTFPRCTLAPGQVAVVFNGYEAKWDGPVGDQNAATGKGNEKYAGALVFKMKVTSERTALANNADWVLLSTRNDEPVQLVKWGTVEGTVANCPLVEDAPATVRCSVQRVGLYGRLEAHDLDGDFRFSPGKFENELQKVVKGKPEGEKGKGPNSK